MAVWYLDTDDEITDAVAHLRDGSDEAVVFVVPPGSRIATGRINFKLLAREADSRSVRMAIASPDDQVRSLATSAGVLVAATPDQAAAALERGDAPPSAETSVPSPVGAATTTGGASTSATDSGSRRGITLVAVIGVLAVAVIGFLLAVPNVSTGEITLAPRVTALGPLRLEITADPNAESVDADAAVVPAVRVIIPLTGTRDFEATGTQIEESPAGGMVTFSAVVQDVDQEIAEGTRVRTPSGFEFQTVEAVVLPRSDGASSKVSATVEAVLPGTDGNVPAGAISLVPSLERQGIEVINEEPMSGGSVVRAARVAGGDYDAAAVDLRNRLEGDLADALRDPESLAPGLAVFPETKRLGGVAYQPAPEAIVGQEQARFGLEGTAAASVLAVDLTLAEQVLRTRLMEAIPEGAVLLDDSLELSLGEGTARGDLIELSGTIQAASYARLDEAQIQELIAGLPIPEARAILESFGQTTVNVWPGFLGDLPGDGSRITIEISEPTTAE